MVLASSYNMPMFATFAVANNSQRTVYKNFIVHATCRRKLKTDSLNTLMLQMNGFKTELPPAVRNAALVLSEYLGSRPVSVEEVPLDVVLLDDCLNDYNDIITESLVAVLPGPEEDEEKVFPEE